MLLLFQELTNLLIVSSFRHLSFQQTPKPFSSILKNDTPGNMVSNPTHLSDDTEMEILSSPYYRDVAPVSNNRPVKVKISVIINYIQRSAGNSDSFDVDLFFETVWVDVRLQAPTNAESIAQKVHLSSTLGIPQYRLSGEWRSRLWTPAIYFLNAIRGGQTPSFSDYFLVSNYTEVFSKTRLSLRLDCPMNLATFPFDTQICPFNISTR